MMVNLRLWEGSILLVRGYKRRKCVWLKAEQRNGAVSLGIGRLYGNGRKQTT
jgi:hypothetical protein